FGRNLGDVRIELFLDQGLDPRGERRECVAVTAVRCVRAGVLEEEPALDLHLLRGGSVVPPALPELEKAFDGCADRDDEAHDPRRDLSGGARPAVERVEGDERRHDDRADDRDQAQAIVEPLRLGRLAGHPQELVEPAQLEEVPLSVVERRVVDQMFERPAQLVLVRRAHASALPDRMSSRSHASEFRSRASTASTRPVAASVVSAGSDRFPRAAAASASAVRPLPSSTTTRRPASMLCRASATVIGPPFARTVAEGSRPATAVASSASHEASSPQSEPGTNTKCVWFGSRLTASTFALRARSVNSSTTTPAAGKGP